MKKLLFVAFLAITNGNAADPARDARWRQDLDYLSTELPKRHPNLFFQAPRAEFDRAVADLRSAIPDLDDVAIEVGLARIVAIPGDGHTNLFLTQRPSSFRMLPLRVQWFEDGLFVVGASAAYAQALAAKVVAIGDRTADEAYTAVSQIISRENDIWAREVSPNYLVNADVLQALKIAPGNLVVRFAVEDRKGVRFTLDVESLSPGASVALQSAPDAARGATPLYRQNLSRNYWFTYIESTHLLYFAYNACREMSDLPFRQFNDQLWAVFDSKPVERMVIDLRNNSGGSSSVLDPFLESGFVRQARFNATRPYIILGRRTYSSAILNAIQMKQGPVVLVGEPTGGSPNSYGEVQTLLLPNSQWSVSYSTRYFSYPQFPPGSMLPDVAVPIYSGDYFARHDPFLSAALADTATTVPAVRGAIAVVNAANFRQTPVAPGSLAAAFGDFQGAASRDSAGLPLPRELDGVSVLINGTLSPLIAVRPGQINFQVPAASASGPGIIQVVRGGTAIATGTIRIAATGPSLFVADPWNPAAPGAILDENSRLAGAAAPVLRGHVIQIFATGQGATDVPVEDGSPRRQSPPAMSKLLPRVYVGNDAAEVIFSGLHPEFPGLWQINVRVPESSELSGEVPVFVTIGSNASNAVTVPVGN